MRNCIKCQTPIDPDVKFCPRCGKAQPKVAAAAGLEDGSEAETQMIDRENSAPVADTIKVTRRAPFTTATSSKPTSPRNWRGLLLGVGIFIVSILIGAILALGLRSHKNKPENKPGPVAQNPPTKSNPPVVIIQEPAKNESESSTKSQDESLAKNEKSPTATVEPKASIKNGAKEERAEKASPQGPSHNTPRTPSPPAPEDLGGIEPDDRIDSIDRGFIGIRFRVSGEALVKIHGGDASVIPLADSTIGDVERTIGRPLPFDRCQVKIRQRSTSDVVATLVEKPNRKNNFTATIRVTNTSPDYGQEARAGFILVWRLKGPRSFENE